MWSWASELFGLIKPISISSADSFKPLPITGSKTYQNINKQKSLQQSPDSITMTTLSNLDISLSLSKSETKMILRGGNWERRLVPNVHVASQPPIPNETRPEPPLAPLRFLLSPPLAAFLPRRPRSPPQPGSGDRRSWFLMREKTKKF